MIKYFTAFFVHLLSLGLSRWRHPFSSLGHVAREKSGMREKIPSERENEGKGILDIKTLGSEPFFSPSFLLLTLDRVNWLVSQG